MTMKKYMLEINTVENGKPILEAIEAAKKILHKSKITAEVNFTKSYAEA